MDYVTWEQSVPEAFTTDPLWRGEADPLALFLGDLGWDGLPRMLGGGRTLSLADQLYRALGGIGSQIGEGYSRGTGRDRARFYEYALGSTRESRDWYYKGRHILGESVVTHRLNLLTQIARLLLVMIPDQRGQQMREETAEYGA